MATERLPMRCVREILRQKLVLGRSNRQVATSLDVSNGTVSSTSRCRFRRRVTHETADPSCVILRSYLPAPIYTCVRGSRKIEASER
jgi:FixJ family two-component response regulator